METGWYCIAENPFIYKNKKNSNSAFFVHLQIGNGTFLIHTRYFLFLLSKTNDERV
jgi:hypothetical protein